MERHTGTVGNSLQTNLKRINKGLVRVFEQYLPTPGCIVEKETFEGVSGHLVKSGCFVQPVT